MSLEGVWRFERSVAEEGVSVSGTAELTRAGALLRYHERGELRRADVRPIEVQRRYLFDLRDDGFDVYFDEEPRRLFHSVLLERADGAWVGETQHLCVDDVYRSAYVFADDGSFSIRHDVQGPHKDYRIVTHYRRAD